MRFLWIGLRKDMQLARRDPFGLLIPIGIPLVLAVLMNMVFGRSGNATPQGVLLVADEDRSFASSLLIGIFAREPLSKSVTVMPVSAADGRARINRGEASAYLRIPAGFQDAAFSGGPSRLELTTDPAEHIVPTMIEQTLSTALETGFYLRKIAGPELHAMQNDPAGMRLPPNLFRYLRSPLIQLETVTVSRQKPFNFAAMFFPSMIFMSLMMVANSLASEIWKERTAGTLRRLAATPVSMAWYLAGRTIFVALLLLCVGLVGVTAVHWMAGVPVSSFPASVAWVTLSGCAFYLCLLCLVMRGQSARTANVIGNMIVFPLSMLGGCFFPFEIMPGWMASIGRLTPNGWAVTQFKALLDPTVHASSLGLSTAGLLAVAAAAFVLAARDLRHRFLV